jgi:hypothetical protein
VSQPWASDGAIGEGARPGGTPFVVGELTCAVIGNAADADPSGAAQGREVSCRFRPGLSGAEETYAGTLQGAGRVDKLFGRGVVMLVVKQHGSGTARPGMLAQSFSAEAAARAGRPGPLTGDRNNAVILQPLIERDAEDGATKGRAADALIVLLELRLEASAA